MTNILDPLELYFKKHNMAADGDDIIVGGETRQQPRGRVSFGLLAIVFAVPLIFIFFSLFCAEITQTQFNTRLCTAAAAASAPPTWCRATTGRELNGLCVVHD